MDQGPERESESAPYCWRGGPSGSGGYLSLESGCTLKDSRVSCLLITLSSSSAPASLSRSINPISGRICSWVSSRRRSGVSAGTERVVAEGRCLVMISPPLVLRGDNVTSAARILFYAVVGTGCVNYFTLGLRGLRESGARVNASGV